MKDLFKLITVVLAAFALAVLVHFTLHTIDKAKHANYAQSEVVNRQFTSFDPSKPISIMTWNIDNAAYVGDETYNHKLVTVKTVYDNLEQIQATLKKNDNDMVLLQNVDKSSEKSVGVDEMKYISRRLNDTSMAYTYDTSNTLYTLELPFASRYSGLLSFSKTKSNSVAELSITPAETLEDKIFNDKYIIQLSKYPIDGTNVSLSVFNINLSDDSQINSKQISDIVEHITREYTENGNIVIVGGTWNAVMDSRSASTSSSWNPNNMERKLSSLILKGWNFISDDLNPNTLIYDKNTKINNYYSLDGFLISPEVTVRKARTIDMPKRVSSHNPVVMEFTINPTRNFN